MYSYMFVLFYFSSYGNDIVLFEYMEGEPGNEASNSTPYAQ